MVKRLIRLFWLGPTLVRIFLSRRLVTETEALIQDRRPDVVVVDCMALALIKGANRSGLPVVVLLHTFAEYWRRTFLRGPIAAMVGALGFSPRALWGAATLRLLLTDPVLDPAGKEPEFADYIWTGTTEVSATFSTTPLPGMRRAYRKAIEALRDLPVEAIVTTGGFDLRDPAPAAPNVQVRGYVPHAEVLPGAALVIGHGGHSTTMKALVHGIPLLVMPLNPTADQGLIGGVVESSGLGRRICGPQRSRDDPARGRRTAAESRGSGARTDHGYTVALGSTRCGSRSRSNLRGRSQLSGECRRGKAPHGDPVATIVGVHTRRSPRATRSAGARFGSSTIVAAHNLSFRMERLESSQRLKQ